MESCSVFFSPYFYTILAVKIGQRCNMKLKIQVSITDVHNQSESESVCLMYQQYNDTFHELCMQLENQVVQIP